MPGAVIEISPGATIGDPQAHSRRYMRRAALILFLLYLAVFPGSTITVALGRVPAWGEWMGGALLLLQGAIVLCWLAGSYGWRGMLAAALLFLLAWGVEYLGVTTGLPFGRYRYTEQLQPQLPGAVPLAISCAWLMVAVGAWQIADCRLQIVDFGRHNKEHRTQNTEQMPRYAIRKMLLAATLVLLLDMQIEPVATAINRYWAWLDGGAYYGVPALNFAAWWVVGLVMMVALGQVLGGENREPTTDNQNKEQRTRTYITNHTSRFTLYALRFSFYAIPASLYLLNTLMFAAINLAWEYVTAGAVGLAVLVVAMLAALGVRF